MSQIVKSTPFPRVLWQFCLCRSAGESTPASHQVLRQVQMQGAGQRPHPCSGVATASCLTSVSPFVITRTLFAKRVHLNNSSFKNNSFFYFCSLKSTAWQWCVSFPSALCSIQTWCSSQRKECVVSPGDDRESESRSFFHSKQQQQSSQHRPAVSDCWQFHLRPPGGARTLTWNWFVFYQVYIQMFKEKTFLYVFELISYLRIIICSSLSHREVSSFWRMSSEWQ